MATLKGLMDRVSSWSAQGKDCKAQTQLLEPPKSISREREIERPVSTSCSRSSLVSS
ncbi:hypothetical protein YC2023_117918 [Brassica napus]